MIDRIKKNAELHPGRTAYKIGGAQLTYRQLWDSACKNADYLCRQGTSPVVIYGRKEPEMIVSMLACLMAGRAYVPVDASMPLKRVEDIVRAVRSSLIITSRTLDINDAEVRPLSELSAFSDLPRRENSNTTAYIIFTSGSTGTPKGVPISYGNLSNFCDWICGIHPLCTYSGTVVLNHASFSFDLSVADIYYSLCSGQTLLALTDEEKADFEKTFDVIRKEKTGVMVMTPTSAKMYLLDKSFSSDNFPELKCIYFCGEQLEPSTARKLLGAFPDLKIINAYGPTEAASAVSSCLIDSETAESSRLLPVGEADGFATEIYIENGEIVLKGKSVFSGYFGTESDKCFCENGVNGFRTGDLGYISDGKLYCTGRKDSQIKYMGYRIELGDIESNISDIDGVENCAVIAKYGSDMTVRSITAFVASEDSAVSADSIKSTLKQRIPQYMIPKTIKVVKELPVNSNGKTDRRVLNGL